MAIPRGEPGVSTLNPYQKVEQFTTLSNLPGGTGGTVQPSVFGGLNAGTIISQREEKNADGSITVITVYADGKGGTYETRTIKPGTGATGNGALDAVMAALAAVGVEGLATVMADIRKVYPDISSEDALMLLKFDPRFNKPYMTRFAGNKMRMDAGFAPLDDKEYLANEAAYNKIFTAYGLDRFANRAEYARQIGNRVAPQELGEKVAMTYDRVIKGAAETRKAIQELNPELTDADLMAVALDPATQLPVITRKIQAAEIGGAALAQNLTIGMTAAPEVKSGYTNVTRKGLGVEELLAQGVDLETARRGFANVAEVLPTAEKLSAIYGGVLDQYGRQQAEEEQFKGLASAKRKREQITEREIAAFSGEAGAGRGAFAKERTF